MIGSYGQLARVDADEGPRGPCGRLCRTCPDRDGCAKYRGGSYGGLGDLGGCGCEKPAGYGGNYGFPLAIALLGAGIGAAAAGGTAAALSKKDVIKKCEKWRRKYKAAKNNEKGQGGLFNTGFLKLPGGKGLTGGRIDRYKRKRDEYCARAAEAKSGLEQSQAEQDELAAILAGGGVDTTAPDSTMGILVLGIVGLGGLALVYFLMRRT